MTTELDRAIELANRVLEHPEKFCIAGDPDSDICVLARQLLRTHEARHYLQADKDRLDELLNSCRQISEARAIIIHKAKAALNDMDRLLGKIRDDWALKQR